MEMMAKKLKKLEVELNDLQEAIDNVTTPWEAEDLEKRYVKAWREYHMIEKQLMD
jgi:hypothetical protein